MSSVQNIHNYLWTPDSGKSYFVIRHIITQHIRKGFTMFVYDFKFDDLSRIAYNTWLKNKHRYPKPPAFYVNNFDDLTRSHRCNPLEPSAINDITNSAPTATFDKAILRTGVKSIFALHKFGMQNKVALLTVM